MSRTLFRHDRIWTGDLESPWTDALLVEDGKVVAVGSAAVEASSASSASYGGGATASVVDLPGALVMPGLHDAHIHTAWLSRDVSSVDLREARSLDETLDLVRAHAAGLPEGEWLHSGRWNHNVWDVPESGELANSSTLRIWWIQGWQNFRH